MCSPALDVCAWGGSHKACAVLRWTFARGEAAGPKKKGKKCLLRGPHYCGGYSVSGRYYLDPPVRTGHTSLIHTHSVEFTPSVAIPRAVMGAYGRSLTPEFNPQDCWVPPCVLSLTSVTPAGQLSIWTLLQLQPDLTHRMFLVQFGGPRL